MNRVAAVLLFAGLLVLPGVLSGQTPTRPAKSARPARTRTPAAKPPIDFSGIWELDTKASVHPNPHYQGSVLSVTQTGDHIWIQPIKQGKGTGVLGEEIVADGRGYEKGIGASGKGIVTAGWSDDRQSLWIEVKAGPADPAKGAMQRSVWKLSEDGSVWVRESVSISQGKAQSARLVFRRRTAESLTPTPGAPPKSRPGKS
ncbi:MAG TPA: hypothetical protein VF376_11425 [Thermoanaerobaculia bacterium]